MAVGLMAILCFTTIITITHKMVAPMTNDDEVGMVWWNRLSEQDRAQWAKAAGTGIAKDAWELFKAGRAMALEDDPLADCHAALLRAISELRALGVAVPISLHQAVHALTYARAKR
jgi:hypothetical protein